MPFYITSTTKETNSVAIFPPFTSEDSSSNWRLEFKKGTETDANLLRIVIPGFELDNNAISGWTQYDGIGNPINEEEYDVAQIPNNWDNSNAPFTGDYDCIDVDISEITGLYLPFNFSTPTAREITGQIQIYLASGSGNSQTFELYDTYSVKFES
jgi:hypothetical protein